MFGRQARDIVFIVHGDDFLSTTDTEDLHWLDSVLKEKVDSEELLVHGKFKKNQSLRARVHFLAIDTTNSQIGAKECCRSMSRPTVRDVTCPN